MKCASFTMQLILFFALTLFISCTPRAVHTAGETQRDKTGQQRAILADAIRISVPLDDSSFLNGIYPIDDNGNALIPILGQIQIRNKTIDSLANEVRSYLEQYMPYPELQIRPLIRASAQGGFVSPGFFYIEPEYSMWELIAMAGGTTSESGLKKIVWERGNKIMDDNIIPYIESGRSLASIGFRSGDQLYTPVDTRGLGEIFVRTVLPIMTFGLSAILGAIAIIHD
jgi:protein involved in polysaccharide export with SLBB domain